MRIVALLCGLVSVLIGDKITWPGLILGAIALILSLFSCMRSTRKGLAIAGIILGILGIVASVSAMMGNPLIHDLINIQVVHK